MIERYKIHESTLIKKTRYEAIEDEGGKFWVIKIGPTNKFNFLQPATHLQMLLRCYKNIVEREGGVITK